MRYNFLCKFRIPSGRNVATYSVFKDRGISVFTDGSKTETDTGSGLFSDDLYIFVSLMLSNIYIFSSENVCNQRGSKGN